MVITEHRGDSHITWSLTTPVTHLFSQTGCPVRVRESCPHIPKTGIANSSHHASPKCSAMWVLKGETWIFLLAQQILYPRSQLPRSPSFFLLAQFRLTRGKGLQTGPRRSCISGVQSRRTLTGGVTVKKKNSKFLLSTRVRGSFYIRHPHRGLWSPTYPFYPLLQSGSLLCLASRVLH